MQEDSSVALSGAFGAYNTTMENYTCNISI